MKREFDIFPFFFSAIQSLPCCLLLSLLTQLDYLTDMTSGATWQFKEFGVLQRGLGKSQDHVSENKHNMCLGVSIIRTETILSVNFRYINVMMTVFLLSCCLELTRYWWEASEGS